RGLPRMYLATGSGLVLRRDAIARDTIVIDERCLLVGKTIGSDGRGIAGAKVKLLQSTPTGKSVFFCTSDDEGAFVYIGSPGEFWTVQASCRGVESAPVVASVGGFPIELLCRTEGLRRLLVRDGEKPILRYQMGRGSLTFGQAAPPWLPEHPEGSGLFPLEAANVYLCWLDHDGVHEAEVSLPAGTPDVVTEIDVASLPRQPFGLLQLQFGDFQGILTLTALAAPRSGLHPLRASFSPSDRGPRLGIRPGRYRLGIKRGFFAGEERSIELELTDGRNDIDVGELLR
ncbi:MAG: hypothetical protein KF830_17890, partial [Planctomycetes bacterium]|nr:hypothetical protein [Planctomycetota bacterium]